MADSKSELERGYRKILEHARKEFVGQRVLVRKKIILGPNIDVTMLVAAVEPSAIRGSLYFFYDAEGQNILVWPDANVEILPKPECVEETTQMSAPA